MSFSSVDSAKIDSSRSWFQVSFRSRPGKISQTAEDASEHQIAGDQLNSNDRAGKADEQDVHDLDALCRGADKRSKRNARGDGEEDQGAGQRIFHRLSPIGGCCVVLFKSNLRTNLAVQKPICFYS